MSALLRTWVVASILLAACSSATASPPAATPAPASPALPTIAPTASPISLPTALPSPTATPAPHGQPITADLLDRLSPSIDLVQRGPSVLTVGFAPDGLLVGAGSSDGAIRLWDSQSGRLAQTLLGHTAGVQSIAFAPTGNTLASGSDDASVRVWSINDGKPLETVNSKLLARVLRVTYSPDGQLLAAGGQMCAVVLLHSRNGILRRTLPQPKCGSESLGWIESWGIAFTPDSQQVITGSGRMLAGGSLWRWTIEGFDRPTILAGYGLPVRDLALTPDGKTLAVTALGGELIWLRDAKTGALLHEMAGHIFRVNDLAFSPDGQLLASASRDGTIRFWRVADGSSAGVLQLGRVDPLSLAFSPDGRQLAIGTRQGGLALWSVEEP